MIFDTLELSIILLFVFVINCLFSYFLLPKVLDLLITASKNRGFYNGPWKTHFGVGLKKTNMIEKAAIARVGLGGNSVEETIYWNAFIDSDRNELNTVYEYCVLIDSPIPINHDSKGFWSITVYGSDQYLMENQINRYMFRNYDFKNIKFPIKIYLTNSCKNDFLFWIPLTTKKEMFSIVLRCYRPVEGMKYKKSAAQIQLPKIIRIK
jgi:hypothetical protein